MYIGRLLVGPKDYIDQRRKAIQGLAITNYVHTISFQICCLFLAYCSFNNCGFSLIYQLFV